MQQAIVYIILVVCAAYVAWRLWENLHRREDPHCAGCPLADTCRGKAHCQTHSHDCCH
ncbi:MAG: hypothetical protein IJ692_03605 [Alloprevotella sp.]|nr:hypothetical protein [Alloprevotella sp.]MBR1652458.1 hypothetical protein [Alloprevotella sp.]